MKMKNSILVIYKNKILLSSADIPMQKSEWSFPDSKMIRIEVPSTQKIPSEDTGKNLLYLRLSDSNVNSIARKSGQRLEFYNLTEMNKLPLSEDSKELLTAFEGKIQILLEE